MIFVMAFSLSWNLDWNFKQKERQRLAMAVETKAGVDAAFENVVEHEVERRELRQIVAHDARRLAAPEGLSDALGRDLLRDKRVVRRITARERDVQPITLVARTGIGDVVQRDGFRAHAPPLIIVTCG